MPSTVVLMTILLTPDKHLTGRSSTKPVMATEASSYGARTSQSRAKALLQSLVTQLRDEYELPGLWIGVVWKGASYTVCAGTKGDSKNSVASERDLLRIGSVTKPLTATLMLALASEGKLDLDTKLESIFPDLRESLRAHYKEATVRHLIGHAAGLPTPGWAPIRSSMKTESPVAYAKFARREVARLSFSSPSSQPIGVRVYSNNGYSILGAVAEAVTGEDFDQLMRGRVFRPLGMTTAGIGMPGVGNPEYVSDKPNQPNILPLPSNDQNPAAAPNGGAYLALSDANVFMKATIQWHRGGGPLLTKSILKQLSSSPYSEEATLVWPVQRDPQLGLLLVHGGANSDARGAWNSSVMQIFPNAGLGIFAVTNKGIDNSKMFQIASRVYRFVLETSLVPVS